MKQHSFWRRVFIPGLAGTTAMTLYSYLVSLAKGKDYKEPMLLGKMTARLLLLRDDQLKQWAGWLMHYGMGLLFAELYTPFWKPGNTSSNVRTGLVLGGISGVAAILIWKFTLAAHPLPPSVDFTGFAGVLFIAHVVFGVFAALGFGTASHPAVNDCISV